MNIVLLDPKFFIEFFKSFLLGFYFLFASFIAFYIPGEVLIGDIKKNFSSFEKIPVFTIVGIVAWCYQVVLFGYVQLRFLTYLYLLLFLFIWIRNKNYKLLSFPKFKINFFLAIIFLFGILGQTAKFWIGGLKLSDGIHLFASANDDALWHLALTEQIVRRFPPFEPGLVNEIVRNYHYWGNIVIAELIRVFKLPLLQTQFQYVFVLTSFLLGAISYTLAKRLNFNKYSVVIFVYFQYFTSDILYLITFITRHVFDFSIGPIDGGVEFLENPPRAFSVIVGFCCLIFLQSFLKKKNLRSLIIFAFLLASLVGFKINTGIAFIIGAIGASLVLLARKQPKILLGLIIAFFLSLGIFLPVNSGSGGLLLTPFWVVRDFVVQPGLKLSNLELAREVYSQHSNFLQSLRMDLTMLILFLIAQFGIKSLAFIPIKTMFKKIEIPIIIFVYFGIVSGIVLGTFFIQQSGGANSFNFFLASAALMSIPASFVIGETMSKNLYFRITLILLIIGMTMPRWIYRTNLGVGSYFRQTIPVVNSSELNAMEFIRDHTNSNNVVLVFNQGTWDSLDPYISAFTQRDMFLSGQGILKSHVIDYSVREEIVNEIQNATNENVLKSIMKRNKINILYFFGRPNLKINLKNSSLRLLFQNKSVTLYEL